MRLALLFLACVLSVPLLGGSFRPLAHVRLRAAWLLAVALAVQVTFLIALPLGASPLLGAVILLSYLPAFWFIWLNRAITPIWTVALGAALNVAGMVANGGVLPSDPEAIRRVGLPEDGAAVMKSVVLDDPKLAFLGDWIVLPAPLPKIAVSPGDIVLFLGALATLHWLCGSWLFPRRRRELRRLWASRGEKA